MSASQSIAGVTLTARLVIANGRNRVTNAMRMTTCVGVGMEFGKVGTRVFMIS